MAILKLTLCVLAYFGSSVTAANSDYSLKSISVVFRHGDRTPEPPPNGLYPTDPYRNYTFEPMGLGGLTNDGKRREHQIGKSLRDRYNDFLGDTYRFSELSVVSTDHERTKMSALLVLAGLYPPQQGQIWQDDLNWQPIPINSVPNEVGTFMKPSECPVYDQELQRVRNSNEYRKKLLRFSELMKNLTTLIGRQIDDTNIIYHLFHTLTAEQAMNLTLPKWTKEYFPNGPIINATIFEYKTKSYNQLLNKLNGGTFVKKVLDDTVFNKKTESPKVHLYSVHENNIAAVLQALNLWNDFVPEYSSAVVFELYERNNEQFFKIVYYKGIPAEFEEQIIPGCTEYCPLDDFLELTKDVLPEDVLEACFGKPENSYLIPDSENPMTWIYGKIRKWFNL